MLATEQSGKNAFFMINFDKIDPEIDNSAKLLKDLSEQVIELNVGEILVGFEQNRSKDSLFEIFFFG